MSELVVFVNLTKQCNMHCPRCYLTEAHRQEPAQLSTTLLSQLLTHPLFQERERCTVIWQGGEPGLVGADHLQRCIDQVKAQVPQAKQTMVSNLLRLPDWLIDIAHAEFNGRLDTTFALGQKFTLDGSQPHYQRLFEAALQKANAQGLQVLVNVELNRETYAAGPEALVGVMERTGHRFWEFDISVDFARFLAQPRYNLEGYPLLTSTLSYAEFSDYVLRLFTDFAPRLEAIGVTSSLIEQAKRPSNNGVFNVQQDGNFLTLNPDGTLTSNPLFSDMPATYLGNLNRQSVNEVLSNPRWARRARYEAKRVRSCLYCEFYQRCQGGASHAPLNDASGECAGMSRIWRHYASFH